MRIKKSNAKFSSIVAIGEEIKREEQRTGETILPLHRGVNMVVPIEVKPINPMTAEYQRYPPNQGRKELRTLIQKEYFPSKGIEGITITAGGMGALDFTFQILDVKAIWIPELFWGSYVKIGIIRGVRINIYDWLPEIGEDEAIIICDPSNPTGIKANDDNLVSYITNCKGTVIVDCPYRRLFIRDDFFDRVTENPNVIVCESFSKWVGLSGLRVGFIYSGNEEFNRELQVRVLYEYNGVSTASQMQVEQVLLDNHAVQLFRTQTSEAIKRNISYLQKKGLLMDLGGEVMGIFAVCNLPHDRLMKSLIGSVPMGELLRP